MMRFIETLYADPLLKFLVDTTMKSFVIFTVAGLFAFCLRRKSAAVRGFVWSMAIVGCLIVPLFSVLLPKWGLGIGVSLDTEEEPLRDYLKENDIQWRQIFSGQRWDSPLAQKYDIHAIPAPWLIAKDGTLISREARVWALERMVIEALKDKSTNQ